MAFALKLFEALHRPLHIDEGFTLETARLSFAAAAAQIRQFDYSPPLVIFALHPLEALGAPDWIARLVMLACAGVSIASLYWMVKAWTNVTAARIAAVMAAFMPSLLFYDSWVRMYAVFDAAALLSFGLLSMLLTSSTLSVRARRASWVGWTACTAVMWYAHYLGFAVTGAQLIYAAVVRRDALARAFIGALGAAIIWSPEWPAFRDELQRGGINFSGLRGHELGAIAILPAEATVAPQSLDLHLASMALAAVVWIWIGLTLATAIARRRDGLLAWLAGPSLCVVIFSLAAHKLLYVDRYHLLLAYGLAAWTGVAIAKLRETGTRTIAGTALALVIVVLGVQSARYASLPRYSTAQWPQVAALLRAQTQPADLVVMDQGFPAFTLAHLGALAKATNMVVVATPPRTWIAPAGFHRVWYVGFQTEGLDPDQVIYRAFARARPAIGKWRFDKALPQERVDVVLFGERSRSRQGFGR